MLTSYHKDIHYFLIIIFFLFFFENICFITKTVVPLNYK